jgi:hypothetical protein
VGRQSEDWQAEGIVPLRVVMAHRIRWALGREPVASKLAGIVEIDEAHIGGSGTPKPGEHPKGRSVV